MTTCNEVAQRFAQEAGKSTPRFLRPRANVLVNPYDDRVLCSYGTHFTLVKIMLDCGGDRSWWLLNGDTYSQSTSRHQGYIRQACRRTGLPVLIVPFSVLAEAGIDHDSITPIGVEDDQFITHTHYAGSRDDIPEPDRYVARLLPDGRWSWQTRRHVLGASVFRATYRTTVELDNERRTIRRVAYFLSAFDEQETRPHYFLCELPAGAGADHGRRGVPRAQARRGDHRRGRRADLHSAGRRVRRADHADHPAGVPAGQQTRTGRAGAGPGPPRYRGCGG
jgi:hypothetical protein